MLLPLLIACSESDPQELDDLCRSWGQMVESTLDESPTSLPALAASRGHCTQAEDHIISRCAELATGEAQRGRLMQLTEDYEEACRAGRHGGMLDPNGPTESRAEAWREALTGVSAAFDSILGEIDDAP